VVGCELIAATDGGTLEPLEPLVPVAPVVAVAPVVPDEPVADGVGAGGALPASVLPLVPVEVEPAVSVDVDPVVPVVVLDPLAPVVPLAPLTPEAPLTPVAPVAPLAPLAPLAPVAPLTPLGPVASNCALAPVLPVEPNGLAGEEPICGAAPAALSTSRASAVLGTREICMTPRSITPGTCPAKMFFHDRLVAARRPPYQAAASSS
jgi:hypothetical protein